MRFVFVLAMTLCALSAHAACISPLPPYIPDPAASTRIFGESRQAVVIYVRALDGYMSCVKDEATGLKPLEAKAAYDDYARALVLMHQTVDAYNAALAAHGAGS